MDSNNNGDFERYSIIENKNKREIVLLRGSGCVWKKCTFCDYHFDYSKNIEDNYKLNKDVLNKVSGVYEKLEIINSGSFCELDIDTREYISKICKLNNISEISVELHWVFRGEIEKIKKFFYPIHVNFKIGIETFDVNFRETKLKKGMEQAEVDEIKQYFQDCCLLIGILGQTKEQIMNDIEIALSNFNRVCINVFNNNTTDIKRDDMLVEWFVTELYDKYIENERIDILIENTEFGVGS